MLAEADILIGKEPPSDGIDFAVVSLNLIDCFDLQLLGPAVVKVEGSLGLLLLILLQDLEVEEAAKTG